MGYVSQINMLLEASIIFRTYVRDFKLTSSVIFAPNPCCFSQHKGMNFIFRWSLS